MSSCTGKAKVWVKSWRKHEKSNRKKLSLEMFTHSFRPFRRVSFPTFVSDLWAKTGSVQSFSLRLPLMDLTCANIGKSSEFGSITGKNSPPTTTTKQEFMARLAAPQLHPAPASHRCAAPRLLRIGVGFMAAMGAITIPIAPLGAVASGCWDALGTLTTLTQHAVSGTDHCRSLDGSRTSAAAIAAAGGSIACWGSVAGAVTATLAVVPMAPMASTSGLLPSTCGVQASCCLCYIQ